MVEDLEQLVSISEPIRGFKSLRGQWRDCTSRTIMPNFANWLCITKMVKGLQLAPEMLPERDSAVLMGLGTLEGVVG